MYPRSAQSESVADRATRLFTDKSRRVTLFIVTAYVTAALGLGVAFLGGVQNPNSDTATVGLIFLFVSFASLFYVSVTVLNLEHGD